MQQGKQEISAAHVKYTDKAIITSRYYPLLLRCEDDLHYHIHGYGMCESTFKFHRRQGINIDPVE